MTWINENVEKTLAIMAEEGEPWLIVDIGGDDDGTEIYATNKTLKELEDEYQEYVIGAEKEDDGHYLPFNEWIEDNYEKLEVVEYDQDDNNGWLVCTDSEADEEWDRDLDNYIDECVLPEIPKAYRNYFDDESYKRDCKYDGRGHSLARYDGYERNQVINGTTYYLYKQ